MYVTTFQAKTLRLYQFQEAASNILKVDLSIFVKDLDM